jgi:hypothetical protein
LIQIAFVDGRERIGGDAVHSGHDAPALEQPPAHDLPGIFSVPFPIEALKK